MKQVISVKLKNRVNMNRGSIILLEALLTPCQIPTADFFPKQLTVNEYIPTNTEM